MRLLLGLVCIFCFTISANGELLVEENFDYDFGELEGNNGGTGFGDGWEVR